MTRQALILVDIQNDYFADGKWPLSGADAAADRAAQILAATRTAGQLVIHIRHEFPTAAAPFFAPGSDGARIHAKVLNRPDEAVLVKQKANSFLGTGLKEQLDQAGVTDLVVVGSMSHMCIDATVRAARDFGFNVVLIHDACATRDLAFDGVTVPAAQVHAAFMAALGSSYATVRSTAEHLATLNGNG